MHTLALQLAPILGAEKSKVPFYIAGGALVAWALFVAMALGMRKPDFPAGLSGQRAVSAITAVLVIAVASTAVITSGGPKPAAASTAAPSSSSTAAEAPSASASSTPETTTAPASTTPASTTPAAAAPASTSLALSANPEGRLTYSTKALSAKAGNVTIKLANASPVEHNVTIALGSTVLGAAPTFAGGSKTIALKLKPGKYSFYCSVPGHRQAGMEGTLTVS